MPVVTRPGIRGVISGVAVSSVGASSRAVAHERAASERGHGRGRLGRRPSGGTRGERGAGAAENDQAGDREGSDQGSARHGDLLTGLRGALAAGASSVGEVRIVSVSSSGHQLSPVIFDDLHFAFRPYDPWLAYGQSKTANVLFAVEATRRWAKEGITANALMPGAIFTNLQRHVGGKDSGATLPAEQFKSTQQGAATSVLLATSPQLQGIGGRYFVDCNETETVDSPSGTLAGVARYALDPANAARLWEVSEQLVG
jgi:NAD(P)-dependent dehydrogenase (short-subunit alcohol dehydrogenase family)